jgi:tetratricopeptide (TPR) repeat protein
MFGRNLRIVMGVICFVFGCIIINYGMLIEGALLILSVLFITYGYFRNGTVWKAFQSIKKNNFAKAKKELSQISKPDLLSKSQKGYYYWALGLIKLKDNDLYAAEEHIRKALDFGVRTENDIALLNLNLAQIFYQKEQFQEAYIYLNKTKDISHKSSVDVYILELEQMLNKINLKQS